MNNLCAKFNDALNDAVAKVDQYILTINSCSQYKHFDKKGNLSLKGKHDFWWELDDLIDRFEANRVKLLPNPKNNHTQKTHHLPEFRDVHKGGCKLLTPTKSNNSRNYRR